MPFRDLAGNRFEHHRGIRQGFTRRGGYRGFDVSGAHASPDNQKRDEPGRGFMFHGET